MPQSQIAFSAVMTNCTQANVIKAVTQKEPIKMAGGRLKDRHPSVGKLQLRKQVSSAAFTTLEPLKEFK